MKKVSRQIESNYQFTRFLHLALSISILSSTCLPAMAVLSAPPSTSKSKTEAEKKEKEKAETETKTEAKAQSDSKPAEAKEEKNEPESTKASESKKSEQTSQEEKSTNEGDKKEDAPKLEIVAPVLDKPSKEELEKLKKEDSETPAKEKSTEESNEVEPSPEKKSEPASKSDKDSDFGYDEESLGKTKNKNSKEDISSGKSEAEPEAEPQTLEVEQSFQTEESTPASDTGDSEVSSESENSDTETASEPVEEEVTKPKHIAEADQYLLKNQFERAEKAYRLLLEEDENGDAYAGLAVALAKQENAKKVVEAEEILKKGKEDFPDNPNMMAAAGFVAFKHSKNVASPSKRDRYVEASEQLCGMAISSNPEIVIAQQTLGMVKLFQDEAEEAIPPFKVCYELTEDETNATLLAKALLRVNPKDRQAKSLIEEALEINPEYSPAVLQKAVYLTNTGKHEEAFTELHSIPRPERESEWYQVQGDIYKKQGDGNSSVNSWKESMRRNPRSPDPYKRLAEHYTMRGDGELAIAEMHSALEILPNDINMRQKLAELALRMDKLEVAEQEFRTILAVKPDDPSAVLGLARVFFRKARREGQYPQGWIELKNKLQDVIMKQSMTVTGHRYKAKADNFREKIQLTEAEKALTQKQFRDARRLFGEIINKHQDEPFQLLTLAEQAYNDGDLKSAELAYSYAREIPEVAPRAEQGISKIISQKKEAKRQIKLGDATEKKLPDVAEDHYKQALIADPQDANAFYNLFFLYVKERKDQLEKAIDYGNGFLEASEDTDGRRQQVEKILFKVKDRLRKQRSK